MPTRALRRSALPLLFVAGGGALVACGGPPSTGDMRDRAEDFIGEDLESDPQAGGIQFEDIECQEPSSTESNTAFVCTATGSNGQAYTFTVTIAGRNRLELVSQPPLPGGAAPTPTSVGATTSVPAAGATTTTAAAATTTTSS